MYICKHSWCTKSNIKEVSRFCSPEVEYLMISCRPQYLPRDFSSIFFIAVYIPPQTDAGTKATFNEQYTAISKQENAHPEAALLVAGDFNAGKLNSVFTSFLPACATREKKNSRPPTPHTETLWTRNKLSLALHLTNPTKILSSRFLLTSQN